jgi:hypothetical protein
MQFGSSGKEIKSLLAQFNHMHFGRSGSWVNSVKEQSIFLTLRKTKSYNY